MDDERKEIENIRQGVFDDDRRKIEEARKIINKSLDAWLVFKPNVYRLLDFAQKYTDALEIRTGKDLLEGLLDFLKRIVSQDSIVLDVKDLLKGELPPIHQTVYGYDEYNGYWERVELSASALKPKETYFVHTLYKFEIEQMHRWIHLPILKEMRNCSCGAKLTEKDVARNARNYGGELVCYGCYVRLCEDIQADEQSDGTRSDNVGYTDKF